MNARSFVVQRPLACLAAAYGAGILVSVYWEGFKFFLPLIGLAAGAVAAWFLWQKTMLRFAVFCFAFLFLGVLLGGAAAYPQLPEAGSWNIEAKVSGESERSDDGLRVKALLRDVKLHNNEGQAASIPKAYWTYYPETDSPLPVDGQSVLFNGQVYHPEGQMNPFGFDFKAYLLQRGIPVGISGVKELVFSPENPQIAASVWLRARQDLSLKLDQVFGVHSPLAKALLIGVRSDLEEEVTADFRDAGIAHVLAVSGLHVSFLVFALILLLRIFQLSPKMILIISACFLLLYCRLLDFTPSIVRAGILTLVLLSGKVVRRRIDPLTSLAAAFLVILLFRPLDLFNLGFQLSFLAVFGIFTLGDRCNAWSARQRWFQNLPGVLQKALQAYFITLSASLMTLVPIVNAFHSFSLIGLLIGPAAILLIGWLMAGFLIGLFASFVSLPLAQILAWPVGQLAFIYQTAVSFFADLPYAVIHLPAIQPLWFSAYYWFLWLCTRFAAVQKKTRIMLMGGLLCMLTLLPLLPKENSLRYIQFSAGFADSALILDGQTTWVIDAGEHGGDLASFLRSEGRSIDKMLITHLHKDHVGGLRQIMDSGIKIGEIFLPYGAREAKVDEGSLALLQDAEMRGIPVRTIGKGDNLQSGRVAGEVLWPYQTALYPGMDANHGALVIYWNLDGVSLLGTSDLSAGYAQYAYWPAQVLKLPHHGSKADNSAETLALVSPQLAIITASGNRPERYQSAQEILGRMKAAQIVTGQSGAVTLRIQEQAVQVSTHRAGRD